MSRITQLTLAVAKLDQSAGYYRKLLGQETENPAGTFRVGKSKLVLGPATGGDHFRVGIVGFDPSAAAKKLKSLGVAADVAHDQNFISFSDPDGMKVEIGG